MYQPRSLLKRQSGDVTAPAVCFPACNDAIAIAQKAGKTPDLCLPGSAFIAQYKICTQCIQANGEGKQVSLQSYDPSSSENTVLPEFAQYISYCDLAIATSTAIFTLTDGEVSTIFYIVPAAPSASTTSSATCGPSSTLCATDLGGCCKTGFACGKGFCYATASTSSSPTTSPTITPAITAYISSTTSSATSSTTSSTTSQSMPNSSTRSKAWIAGAVVGPIAALGLILGLIFYFRKRGRKTTIAHNESGSPYEKAELHADEVKKPVYETETHEIHEVEGSSPSPAEKPANETLMELAAVEAKREGEESKRDNETK